MFNMIRFPDRDPTGFCYSEPDRQQAGFWKNSTGSDMDIQFQTKFITASNPKCSKIRWFFLGYKTNWIKNWDSTTGLGSDWITQWKYWTGLGLQKSPMRWTLVCTRRPSKKLSIKTWFSEWKTWISAKAVESDGFCRRMTSDFIYFSSRNT